MEKLLFCFIFLALVSCNKESSTKSSSNSTSIPGSGVTDINGRSYKTIKIGNQEWMAENLDVTMYNDKKPIKQFKYDLDNIEAGNMWRALKEGVWHYHQGVIGFGKIYNGYVVDSKKVCPSGWHIPSKIEWETLINNVGGEQKAGINLKEAGYKNWEKTNWSAAYDTATNSSGFTAIPTGNVNIGMYIGFLSAWYWTSDLTMISIDNDSPSVSIHDDKDDLTDAAAIRCIKN